MTHSNHRSLLLPHWRYHGRFNVRIVPWRGTRSSAINSKLSLFCVFYFHINEFYCWFHYIWRPPTSKLEHTVSIAYVYVHLNFCRSNLCILLFQFQSIISKEKVEFIWSRECSLSTIFEICCRFGSNAEHCVIENICPCLVLRPILIYFLILIKFVLLAFLLVIKEIWSSLRCKKIIKIWVRVNKAGMLYLIIRVIYSEMALVSS